MKRLVVLAGACSVLLPGTAAAQDIQPVFDLPTMAQGQVISSTAKANADRGYRARRGPTQAQADACAARPRLRREYGNTANVRKIERICRGLGL